MHTFKKKLGALSLLYFTPFLALAQTDATTVLGKIGDILNTIIPLIIGLAFVFFLWGVFQYTTKESSEDKAKAREYIIYGIIGLFVMLAAWGLVNVLTQTFDLDTATPTDIPGIPGI